MRTLRSINDYALLAVIFQGEKGVQKRKKTFQDAEQEGTKRIRSLAEPYSSGYCLATLSLRNPWGDPIFVFNPQVHSARFLS
jgi:hypothetical protein